MREIIKQLGFTQTQARVLLDEVEELGNQIDENFQGEKLSQIAEIKFEAKLIIKKLNTFRL